MKDRFSQLHPAVNFCYFALVIGFSLAVQHPICQAVSLVCAGLYARKLTGSPGFWLLVKLSLPLALFTAVLNPLFNHRGLTPLFSLPWGGFVTLESLLYGLSAGAMLFGIMLWFACFNEALPTDRFLYLFGGLMPGLSLVLSMSIGFVPRFIGQYRAVSDAQKGLGRDMTRGSWVQRGKNAAAVLSVTLSWALENAADTADSMKSRGYGGKRSRYALYPFTRLDGCLLAAVLIAGGALIAGGLAGCFRFDYFPALGWKAPGVFAYFCFAAQAALCALPLLYDLWEERKWNSLHSKI